MVIPAKEKARSLATDDTITARSSPASEHHVEYQELFNYNGPTEYQ